MGLIPLERVFIKVLAVLLDVDPKLTQFISELIFHREQNVVNHIRQVEYVLIRILDILLQLLFLGEVDVRLPLVIELQVAQCGRQFANLTCLNYIRTSSSIEEINSFKMPYV
jgi:hypothetical protein